MISGSLTKACAVNKSILFFRLVALVYITFKLLVLLMLDGSALPESLAFSKNGINGPFDKWSSDNELLNAVRKLLDESMTVESFT